MTRSRESNYNYFRDYDPGIGRYLRSDPVGLQAGLNTYAYVEGSPLRFTDGDGTTSSALDPYPNCPRTPDGASCRAGIETTSQRWNPLKGTGTLSINVQLAKVYNVPVGIAFSCNVGPEGVSGTFLGAGIVANTNGQFSASSGRAGLSTSVGDPSGWGFRGNASSGPIFFGMGASGSVFTNCMLCKKSGDGTSTNFGIGPMTGPSGSLTFGYRWK